MISRLRYIRTASVAVVVALHSVIPLHAQPSSSAVGTAVSPRTAPVPFGVGEELVFRATFGKLPAGTARMRVEGIDTIRNRAAYHVTFAIDGGILFFRVHDSYESWIDVESLSSLRHRQRISEGRYHRNTTYELFPEAAMYQKDSEPLRPSVSNPLDDGSFVYAVRSLELRVGDTVRTDRYFVPEKNPVVLTAVREETVTVASRTYAAIVVKPSINTTGIFSENGHAEIWFSNDRDRLPLQLKTRFSRFSLTLALVSVTLGEHPVEAIVSR